MFTLVGCYVVDPLRFDINTEDVRIMPYDVKEPTIRYGTQDENEVEEEESELSQVTVTP